MSEIEYPEVYKGNHGFGNYGAGPQHIFDIRIGWAGNFKTHDIVKDSFKHAYLEALDRAYKSCPSIFTKHKYLVCQPIPKLSMGTVSDVVDVIVNNGSAQYIATIRVSGFIGVADKE